MRYKTSDVIKPVIRELVPAQELGSRAWNKEAIPSGRRVGPSLES